MSLFVDNRRWCSKISANRSRINCDYFKDSGFFRTTRAFRSSDAMPLCEQHSENQEQHQHFRYSCGLTNAMLCTGIFRVLLLHTHSTHKSEYNRSSQSHTIICLSFASHTHTHCTHLCRRLVESTTMMERRWDNLLFHRQDDKTDD